MSFVPEHRLMLAAHVGRHEEADAGEVVAKSRAHLARPLPLFVSDGWDAYIKALLGAYHQKRDRPRTGRPGHPPGPETVPDAELRYAQLVKIREKGRVVGAVKRIIFGEDGAIDLEQVSTSLVERQNLTLRHDNRRLTRKTIGFSKCLAMLKHQLDFHRVYYNFVRSHRALRQETDPEAAGGTRRKWRARTPAMSAGLTDHVWGLRELLTWRPGIMSTN